MGKMTVEPNSLAHLVLYQADDDWLAIGSPNYYAGFFENDVRLRKILLVSTIRRLAEAGYLQIGELKRLHPEDPDSLDWVRWPGTIEEQLLHLDEVYTPDSDDDGWYWACWLNITEAGRATVEALPKPAGRFFRKL
jgi:hypothetical protein